MIIWYFKKEEEYCFKKTTFKKWDCGDDFITEFDTDRDIALLKCKLCRKYTAQIRTEPQSHNLCGQILDSILSYVDTIIYIHKAMVYNQVKAGGLHDWAKKIVMDS